VGPPRRAVEALTAGNAVVGAFSTYSQLYYRKGIEVQVGYINTQFIEGKVTLRADVRVAFVIYRGARSRRSPGCNPWPSLSEVQFAVINTGRHGDARRGAGGGTQDPRRRPVLGQHDGAERHVQERRGWNGHHWPDGRSRRSASSCCRSIRRATSRPPPPRCSSSRSRAHAGRRRRLQWVAVG
jgi:hypothetical protein